MKGSFTSPDTSELLFVVRIDNCQGNTFTHHELALFRDGIAKPLLRWSEHRRDGEKPGPCTFQ